MIAIFFQYKERKNPPPFSSPVFIFSAINTVSFKLKAEKMICLYATESHLSTLTLIFFTSVWIPFLQIKQAIVKFFIFLLDPHNQPESSHFEGSPEWELDLPVSKYQDLGKNGGEKAIDSEEMCSICLVEFEKGDFVNELPKCRHIFHMGCLEKWLDKCQFTCPLCRSLLLRVRSSPPCTKWASPFCINLPHALDS